MSAPGMVNYRVIVAPRDYVRVVFVRGAFGESRALEEACTAAWVAERLGVEGQLSAEHAEKLAQAGRLASAASTRTFDLEASATIMELDGEDGD